MADHKTPSEIAERSQKRRAAVLTIFPILYLAQQAHFHVWSAHRGQFDHMSPSAIRLVDKMQIVAYVVWAIALLILLATGGGLFRGKAVRELLSDEVTKANRATAYAVGFWTLILACVGHYIASFTLTLSASEVLNGLLTIGVVAPCLTFAFLERRALRG